LYFNAADLSCDYFSTIGYNCPEMSNPADYYMTVMSAENPNETDVVDGKQKTEVECLRDYSKKISYLNDQYQQSELKNDFAYKCSTVTEVHMTEISNTMTSWLYQLTLLSARSGLNLWRLPGDTVVKLFATVITGFFVDILFQEMKGTMEGVQNRNGCLFFICTAISFNAIQTIILLFPEERPVFLREVNNKMYSVSAYFFGKLISEVPSTIIVPIV
jgi:ABC-type multidrug transport system permease subunit